MVQNLQNKFGEKDQKELLLQLTAIVENSHDAILGETLDGIVTSWNGGAQKMFGYSSEEAIGKSILFLFPHELEYQLSVLLNKVGAGEIVADYDTVRLRKDGSRVDISLSASPIRLEDGTIIGVSVVERDITKHKRLENELLKKSTDKYKNLFLSSRDAIMTLEPPSWKFTSSNPSTLKMFSAKSESDFLDKEPWVLSPEFQLDGRRSDEKAKEMIEKAMRDGSCLFEWTHKRLNGEEFPAEVFLSKVEEDEKTFLHALVRDITIRKNLEKKLKEYAEEKFKIIFDKALDGIILADITTKKFFTANAAMSQMLGYSIEEIQELKLYDIHPKEDSSFIDEQFTKQTRKEFSILKNARVKRKDGSVFYCDINASPVEIEGKQYLLGIFRDVTDKKIEEEKLRESEERFRKIFENGMYGIILTKSDSKFIKVNPAFCNMVDYSEEELLTKKFSDITHPEDVQTDIESALKMINGEIHFYHTEKRYIKKNGQELWVNLIVSVVRNKDKSFEYFLGMVEDITLRKEEEEHIKELNEMRHKFINIISHQLGTPLTAVNWNLEAILDGDFGKLEDITRNFLQITHRSSIKITQRIHDLLTAMDIEEGRITLEKEETSIDSLVSSVVKEMINKSQLKNISLQYIPPIKDISSIEVDNDKIRTVLNELIENSIIYSKENSKIIVNLEKIDYIIRFKVTDTGVGIPILEQHNIFTRFFRASNASIMQPDAFGLGLFISKSFIKKHGGKIGFESKEGEGSTFWFELPIKAIS